jgi:SAM-dependent methyltransferase
MNTDRRIYSESDVERPSPARIYDYLLGGYHNFEVDREVAQKLIEFLPRAPLVMRANRAFVRRVVRFLVGQGIDQFLDIGSGIPTVGNVHEIAQEINPSAHVVYVDIDPVAVRHGEEILRENANTAIIQADTREPQAILDHPEVSRLLDFGRPIAVLITSVLLFLTEDDEAYRVVRALRDALAPGSYLAISHAFSEEVSPEQVEEVTKLYAAAGSPIKGRSGAQIERFFDGLELVEPGLVYLPLWRPEDPDDLYYDQPHEALNLGAVGRKP